MSPSMASWLSSSPAGRPSTIVVRPGPCDSPAVVKRSDTAPTPYSRGVGGPFYWSDSQLTESSNGANVAMIDDGQVLDQVAGRQGLKGLTRPYAFGWLLVAAAGNSASSADTTAGASPSKAIWAVVLPLKLSVNPPPSGPPEIVTVCCSSSPPPPSRVVATLTE